MKIIFFAYDFPPSNNVGAKRTFSFYNTLISSNHDVLVIKNNDLPNNKNINNSYIKRSFKIAPYFRSIDSSIFSSYFIKSLKKILFRDFPKSDLVLVSYKPIASVLLGILYKFFYRTKLIVDLRDLISVQGHKKRIFLVHIIDVFIDKILIFFADEIITVSPTCKYKADRLYGVNTHLIYNGYDKLNLTNSNCNQERNSINILYSGSLNETRRLDKIYNYIEQINTKIDCKLFVASNQNPFQYGAKEEFTNWVGFINNSELVELVNYIDFFFLVEGSNIGAKENIPAKVYEYISYKKPILIDCYMYSDAVELIEELEFGKLVINYEDFQKTILSHQFNLDADISKYFRQNQNIKLLKIIENL